MVVRPTVKGYRTKKTLANQDALLKTKDPALKKLYDQVDRLTFHFHKQPKAVWMDGYNEALTHMDIHLAQRNREGYKWGWTNVLTLFKHDSNSELGHCNDPGMLDYPDPPFKIDARWILPNFILSI